MTTAALHYHHIHINQALFHFTSLFPLSTRPSSSSTPQTCFNKPTSGTAYASFNLEWCSGIIPACHATLARCPLPGLTLVVKSRLMGPSAGDRGSIDVLIINIRRRGKRGESRIEGQTILALSSTTTSAITGDPILHPSRAT